MELTIRGRLFGVEFQHRGDGDSHVVIQLLLEDDENWFKHGNSFSSFWIDDLLSVLQEAKRILETKHKEDPSGYGYLMEDRGENE